MDVNGDGKLDLLTHFDGDASAPSPAFLNDGHGTFNAIRLPALQGGLWAWVNDKPHTKSRDIAQVRDGGGTEIVTFYKRLK